MRIISQFHSATLIPMLKAAVELQREEKMVEEVLKVICSYTKTVARQ